MVMALALRHHELASPRHAGMGAVKDAKHARFGGGDDRVIVAIHEE